jgi:hypothetical protein
MKTNGVRHGSQPLSGVHFVSLGRSPFVYPSIKMLMAKSRPSFLFRTRSNDWFFTRTPPLRHRPRIQATVIGLHFVTSLARTTSY